MNIHEFRGNPVRERNLLEIKSDKASLSLFASSELYSRKSVDLRAVALNRDASHRAGIKSSLIDEFSRGASHEPPSAYKLRNVGANGINKRNVHVVAKRTGRSHVESRSAGGIRRLRPLRFSCFLSRDTRP